MTHVSINPATGETVARYDDHDLDGAAATVRRVAAAQQDWRRSAPSERAAGLVSLAAALRERRDELARLMALEMGKPLGDGRGEVDKCAWVCEHYAEHGAALLADEPLPGDGQGAQAWTVFEPLGVVLAIMPWNFPLWQVFRFLAPAVAAGNAGVLKHAPSVSGCAAAIEDLLGASDLPDDLLRHVRLEPEVVAELMALPEVAAVTLTGSTRAGRAVAARAGGLLKPQVLELGGSDPYVVLADADLDLAVEACVTSRLVNNGQSCVAAKRFLVESAVYPAFEERFVAAMAERRFGDPLREDTRLGPLARADLRETLHDQVQRSLAAGARLLLGGEVPEGPGAFYPPTVLAGVRPGQPAHDEELFGPVAALVEVADADEALALANRSSFGLGAAVFTRDQERGRRLAASELQAGCCFVNGFVRSDPRWPFGGIKDSGYGRELGLYGPREFMNAKTVVVC